MSAGNDPRPLTLVAVAILERVVKGRHEVLFAQRPVGKVYAGYWEFPGGKIEAGESLHAALAREIDEELGVTVLTSHAWTTQRFAYAHAHVELQFARISHFMGEPQSREQQAFSWQSLDAISVSPLLPALEADDRQLLRALCTEIAQNPLCVESKYFARDITG